MNEIQDFIQRRFSDTDAHWLDGNCYWFAIILCHRFPHLQVYYDPIIGHFYAGDLSEFYDATGLVEPKNGLIILEDIRKTDKAWYSRIIRDCVN